MSTLLACFGTNGVYFKIVPQLGGSSYLWQPTYKFIFRLSCYYNFQITFQIKWAVHKLNIVPNIYIVDKFPIYFWRISFWNKRCPRIYLICFVREFGRDGVLFRAPFYVYVLRCATTLRNDPLVTLVAPHRSVLTVYTGGRECGGMLALRTVVMISLSTWWVGAPVILKWTFFIIMREQPIMTRRLLGS